MSVAYGCYNFRGICKRGKERETNVAKNTKGLASMSASAMACEIPTPSRGDVPRPSSSINTRELEDAKPELTVRPPNSKPPKFEKEGIPSIIAEQAISFANVLKLFSGSSSFDNRVRSAS